jgi:hypothetical protein
LEKMADFKPETEKCPVCDTKWTKTSFGAKTWYDCKPCGKTAEDIVVVKSSTKSGGTKEYKLDSLDEWEAFIDMMNLDDDYDGTPFVVEKIVETSGCPILNLPEGMSFVPNVPRAMTSAEKFEICNELMRQGIIETNEEYWDFIQGL